MIFSAHVFSKCFVYLDPEMGQFFWNARCCDSWCLYTLREQTGKTLGMVNADQSIDTIQNVNMLQYKDHSILEECVTILSKKLFLFFFFFHFLVESDVESCRALRICPWHCLPGCSLQLLSDTEATVARLSLDSVCAWIISVVKASPFSPQVLPLKRQLFQVVNMCFSPQLRKTKDHFDNRSSRFKALRQNLGPHKFHNSAGPGSVYCIDLMSIELNAWVCINYN